jgi:hypothetical protein
VHLSVRSKQAVELILRQDELLARGCLSYHRGYEMSLLLVQLDVHGFDA